MLDRLLKQVNVLEKGLDASWLKNDVIAGNIANVDTPDYKARTISFASMFQDALADDSADHYEPSAYRTFLDSANTDDSGLAAAAAGRAGRSSDLGALDAQVVTNDDTTLRMDGNNVDIDYEMTELAKNAILYDTLTYTASKEIGRLKLIISEGK